MTQMAFYLDATRCTGCKTCVFACKDKYGMELGVAYRHVTEYTGGQTVVDESGFLRTNCFSYYFSISCNHCDNPACVAACPTGSMVKDPGTGLVNNDPGTCLGCGTCAGACPYSAPKIHPQKNIAVKCSGCGDEEMPTCVLACPARALHFGPVEEISAIGGLADFAPLPDPSLTSPNFFVTKCRDMRPRGDTEGFIGNPLEIA